MSYLPSLDWIFLSITGALTFYFGRIYNLLLWNCRITRDDLQNLQNQLHGLHLKFTEDRIDTVNPSRDSGMILSLRGVCTYSMMGQDQRNSDALMSLLGSFGGGPVVEYTVTAPRLLRQKILIMMDTAKREEILRQPKIYVVNPSSVLFVGDIEEEYQTIPELIENRLNGERKSRLNILLWGELGTGKTTLARAIASRLHQSIYILALNSWWELTDFVRALQRIPDNSVILFDDFEFTLTQLLAAQTQPDKSPGTSLVPLRFSTNALMGMLDGIYMKNRSWVVIICTNDPDKVRTLLRLRPGRIHIDFQCTITHNEGLITGSDVSPE